MSNTFPQVDLTRLINLGMPLHIISLGNACYSRLFPERFHIYNFKQNGVRMPFDGCVTPYKSVCDLINNDFNDIGVNLINKGKFLFDTKYNILYSHERST